MYNLFMAGITYLNSLWQAQRCGWTIVSSYVDALMDIHICTGLMEALAGMLHLETALLTRPAVTQGTAGIRDVFESVSERIIRHLTVRAHGASRPPSPGRMVGQTHELGDFNLAGNLGDSLDAQFISNFEPNALDSFLLQPLGQSSMDEWEALFLDLNNEHDVQAQGR